ncbi:MAG: helix-turn-helix domain-containing protein [Clostridia bacterium]|nr:helix-turn-helix domain-containing protein [Clostridia bacterium]
MSVKYEFDSINSIFKKNDYIFQKVSKRKLTDIYHSHDFFEIIIIVGGGCSKIINDKKIDAHCGTVIFMRPGDCHSFVSQSEDVNIVCLSVKVDEAFRIASIYGERAVKKLFSEKDALIINDSEIDFKLNMLIGKASELQNDDFILILTFVLRLIMRESAGEKTNIPSELISAMEKMKKAENIRLGLSAFLDLSNYSHSQLGKLMHKHFGISPHEYIEEIKLGEAYRNLIMTDIPSEEIAERVGYSSFSHFNKIFKKKYGITPAVARKSHIV